MHEELLKYIDSLVIPVITVEHVALVLMQKVCQKYLGLLYMHNLKAIGHIRTIYISNDCSTIADVYFQVQSYMQDMTGKLWLHTTHHSLFPIRHFVDTYMYMYNLKTTHCIWMFCISNDCSTIGDIPCIV